MKVLFILCMLLTICLADNTTNTTNNNTTTTTKTCYDYCTGDQTAYNNCKADCDRQTGIIVGSVLGFFFAFVCVSLWMFNYGCTCPCRVCGGCCCCTLRDLKECCCCCCMDMEIKDYCKRFCCPCLRAPATQPNNEAHHENVIQINKVTQIFQQGANGQPILVSQTTTPQRIVPQQHAVQLFTDPTLQLYQRERIAFLDSLWNFYFYSKSQKFEIVNFKFSMSPIPNTSFYRVTSAGSDRKGTFKFEGKYWLEDDNNIKILMNQNYDNKQAVGQVGQHQTIVWQGMLDSNRNYTGKWYHKGFQMHPDFHGTWELIRIATIDMNATSVTLVNT